MSSTICYEQVAPGQWRDYFCLVNPTCRAKDEDQAAAIAAADLNEAFAIKIQGAGDSEVAMCLKKKGYVSVEGFQRARD